MSGKDKTNFWICNIKEEFKDINLKTLFFADLQEEQEQARSGE